MGKSLDDLGLVDEPLPPQSYDDLPEFGTFGPPPQPGPYRMALPAALDKVWETFDSDRGVRVRMVRDRDNPLRIVRSPDGTLNNDTFRTRLSNLERNRGDIQASDLDYLLRALGEKTRPAGNRDAIQKIIAHAGREFGCDITFSWVCDPKRNVRVYNEQNQLQEVPGRGGCGKKFYQRDIQRVNGLIPVEITCGGCGAVLRAFANLDNIRA